MGFDLLGEKQQLRIGCAGMVGNNKERVKPEKQARELGWHIKDVSMSYL
jgi:hypothetical protein